MNRRVLVFLLLSFLLSSFAFALVPQFESDLSDGTHLAIYKVAQGKNSDPFHAICANEKYEGRSGRLVRAKTLMVNNAAGALAKKAGGNAWIDGSDKDKEGTWVFSDGTVFSIPKPAPSKCFVEKCPWLGSEPTNSGGIEHTIGISTGGSWYDCCRNSWISFGICEWTPQPKTKTMTLQRTQSISLSRTPRDQSTTVTAFISKSDSFQESSTYSLTEVESITLTPQRTSTQTKNLSGATKTNTQVILPPGTKTRSLAEHLTRIGLLTTVINLTLPPPTLPAETTAAPIAPPPKKEEVSATVKMMEKVLPSEEAAVAVQSTSTASVAFTSLSNPAAATSAVRVGALLSALTCAFSEDGLDPPRMLFPIHLSIGPTNFSRYAGAVLINNAAFVASSTLLHLSMNYYLQRIKRAHKDPGWLGTAQEKAVGPLVTVAIGYFVPSAVGGTVLVLRHSGAVIPCLIAMAGFLIGLCSTAIPFFMLIHNFLKEVEEETPFACDEPIKKGSEKIEWVNTDANLAFKETYAAFFDGTDRPQSLLARLYFYEDLLISCLLGGIEGWRPKSGCLGVAIGMVGVCLLHVVYLVIVRPYRTRIETIFVGLTAVLQLMMASLSLVAMFMPELVDILGYLAIIQSVLFTLQAIVMGYWQFHVMRRRKVRAERRAAMMAELEADANAKPLLDVPMGDEWDLSSPPPPPPPPNNLLLMSNRQAKMKEIMKKRRPPPPPPPPSQLVEMKQVSSASINGLGAGNPIEIEDAASWL